MNTVILVVLFLFSFLSLLCYIYCWRDIKAGRPHILSLRQITGVMDRNRINAMFGEPEPGFYYRMTPEMRAFIHKRRSVFYYRECLTDGLCFYASWRVLVLPAEPWIESFTILLVLICQGINLVYSIDLVKKWGYQIREEIEKSND